MVGYLAWFGSALAGFWGQPFRGLVAFSGVSVSAYVFVHFALSSLHVCVAFSAYFAVHHFPALGLLRRRGPLGFVSLSQGLLLSRVGSSLCFCVSGRSHQSCDHGLDLQPSFAAFYLCLIFFFVELQLFGPFVVHSYLW